MRQDRKRLGHTTEIRVNHGGNAEAQERVRGEGAVLGNQGSIANIHSVLNFQ